MPRPDRSRDLLVSTAALLLRRRGYAATSTTDVLRAGGVTTGSLYHHFPGGKEDLAVAALGASADSVQQALTAAFDGAETTGEALERWLDRLAQALRADPRDGCPVAPSALESIHASERLRGAAAGAFERWTTTIARNLVAEGWPQREARTAAVATLSIVEGALLLARTAGDMEALSAAAGTLRTILGARQPAPRQPAPRQSVPRQSVPRRPRRRPEA
jgi:TetR/AcrR family transcriptional repressor of lmrAB and yxaGH operons